MKLLKKIIKYLLIAIAVIAVLNIPLTTRYGVDGVQYVKNIPLYAKACGFLYRDWAYGDIIKSIVKDEKNETKKVLAILNWVNSNIMSGVPGGLRLVDDHPLNIIIRQYGSGSQLEDVFTILCNYAGMRAGTARCYEPGTDNYKVLSFVKAGGRWLVFDAKHNRYFVNMDKKIASIGDILDGKVTFTQKEADTYSRFFAGLKEVDISAFTRAEEQMPIRRLQAKIRRTFNR